VSPPQVNLLEPANDTWSTQATIGFNFSVTDNVASTLNCTLVIDGTGSQTNESTINGVTTTLAHSGFSEGAHDWSVYCIDDAGAQGNSTNRTVHIDVFNPVVSLNEPADSAQLSTNSFDVNFTVTDTVDSVFSCDLFVDASLTDSDAAVDNNTLTGFTLSSLSEGAHTWNVTCVDDSGRQGSDEYTFTIDSVAPEVFLVSPDDSVWDSDGSLTLTYNVTDSGSSISSCSLIINQTVNQTDATIAEDSNQTFSVSSFGDAQYVWSVNCTDAFSNEGASTERSFTVDSQAPSITLVSPAANYNSTSQSVDMVFTPLDALAQTMSCSLTVDSQAVSSNSSSLNNTQTTLSASSLSEGGHAWNVTCADPASNAQTSATRTFTVDVSAPSIAVSAPAQNYTTNQSSVTFEYTPVDSVVTSLTCWHTLDDVTTSDGTVENNTLKSVVLSSLSEGIHHINATCMDGWAEHNTTSQTITFRIDTTLPTIVLSSPDDLSCNESPLSFTYTATDETAETLNCTLYIDESAQNTTIATNNSLLTVSDVALSVAANAYTWYVNCTDGANNRANAVARNVSSSIATGSLCTADWQCYESTDMCGSVVSACEGSSTSSARCCSVEPTADGYYGGGNVPGTDDPVVEERDYYCDTNGDVNYTVVATHDPNTDDGYYGGGNTAGYGDDSAATIIDYYYVNDTLTLASDTTQTVDCDELGEDSWEYCNADAVTNEQRDYFAQLSGAEPAASVSCSYNTTDTQTCQTNSSDSDSGNTALTGGTCTDFIGCLSGGCTNVSYTDTCTDASTLREYYTSGNSCASSTIDCEDFNGISCANTTYARTAVYGCTDSVTDYCAAAQTADDLCSDNDYVLSDNQYIDYSGCLSASCSGTDARSCCNGTIINTGSACADPTLTPTSCTVETCTAQNTTSKDVDSNGKLDVCCSGDWFGADVVGTNYNEIINSWPTVQAYLESTWDTIEVACSFNRTSAAEQKYMLRNSNENLTFLIYDLVGAPSLSGNVILKGPENASFLIALSNITYLNETTAQAWATTAFTTSSPTGVYNLTLEIIEDGVQRIYYLDNYLRVDNFDVSVLRVDAPKIAYPGQVIEISLTLENAGTVTIDQNASIQLDESTTGTSVSASLNSDIEPGETATLTQQLLITQDVEVVSVYPSITLTFNHPSYGELTFNATPAYPRFTIVGPESLDKEESADYAFTPLDVSGNVVSIDLTNVVVYQIVGDDVQVARVISFGTVSEAFVWEFNPSAQGLDCGAYVIAAEGYIGSAFGDTGKKVVVTGCVQ